MKKSKLYTILLLAVFALISVLVLSFKGEIIGEQCNLKDTFKDKFFIGTALNSRQILGHDRASVKVIKNQFNAIVAENCMKSALIQPAEGTFDFTLADQFVTFGEKNGMFITGHCLIWHSQTPDWFFTDSLGKDVSRDVMIERMKNHIYTVVGRYRGRIKGWDVVNEAIMENGTYRKSKFYQIIGEDFIKLAFQFAHEADPDAELYYNDYNEWFSGKREGIVKMIRSLKSAGIRIDGIGMQGHIDMQNPSIEQYEEAIIAYANEGVKVMVTELDMSILPYPSKNVGADISTNFEYRKEMNPYEDGIIPKEKQDEWDTRMVDLFQLFINHSDKISRITLWGVSDGDSWKNNFPMRGRTDYPLFFDRKNQPKSIVTKLAKLKSLSAETEN